MYHKKFINEFVFINRFESSQLYEHFSQHGNTETCIKAANLWTNKWGLAKTFKGALKSKVNHSKRLKVIGQGEILVNQGFDCGRRSTYSHCYVCDTPLLCQITIYAVAIASLQSYAWFFTVPLQLKKMSPGGCANTWV